MILSRLNAVSCKCRSVGNPRLKQALFLFKSINIIMNVYVIFFFS